MAARRRRSKFRRVGANLIWATDFLAATVAAGATSTISLFSRESLQTVADVEPDEVTVLRQVLGISVAANVSGPVNFNTTLWLSDGDEAAQGALSGAMADHRVLWTATGIAEVGSVWSQDSDRKGKVRLRPDDELRWVFTNIDSFGTTESVRVSFFSRLLLKVT